MFVPSRWVDDRLEAVVKERNGALVERHIFELQECWTGGVTDQTKRSVRQDSLGLNGANVPGSTATNHLESRHPLLGDQAHTRMNG